VGECQISYNPLLMALEWESLATREVKLLHASMSHRFKIDPRCAWVNYVRSHDDIGWTFDDGDAARLGINGFNHRKFLNSFYMGRYEGSFARGLPFQENPRTGDARVSGTCASLAGLEMGVAEGDEQAVEMGIRRILLLYSVALSMGGIPLLYFGDEIGTLNDYSYRTDPAKADDSRWVHRPATDWEKVARRNDPGTLEGRVFAGLKQLIDARKGCPALAGGHTDIVDSGNGHVYAYVRHHNSGRVLVLANFSENVQRIATNELRLYGLGYSFRDVITGEAVSIEEDMVLEPYRFVWLVAQ
jgi:amylosucrase